MVATPPRPSPHPPTLTLPPPSLLVTVPACSVGAWSPLPLTPIPNTIGQPRSLGMARTVYVGGGGGLEVKSHSLQMAQFIQKHRGSGYHTSLFDFASSPTGLSFIQRILLRRLSSFSAYSYSTQFHYAPSPMTLSFIKHLFPMHLSSLRAFSYST